MRKGYWSRPEVVVLGAGLAGMTAAHELAGCDLVVLEALDRVGGRTFSGEHGGYWYNLGAQFVWDRRTLASAANWAWTCSTRRVRTPPW